MEKEPTPTSAPDDDGGEWRVESHSAPSEPTPADTTVQAAAEPAAPVAAATPAPEPTDDPEPEPAAEPAAQVAADGKPAKGKKGPTLTERKQALTREIGELTYRKHTTNREIEEAQTLLTKRRAELAELEVKKPAAEPAAPAAAAPAPAVAAAAEMPAHPNYKDFETDAEYDEAVTKWRTDVLTWQTGREDALKTSLKTDITNGLDERLTKDREDAHVRAEQDRQATSVRAAQTTHVDWDEKFDAFRAADIRSPWNTTKPEIETPFLSDIVQNSPDPGETFYWLISDVERARALAELHPTRPLRDAIVMAPSSQRLLEYFVTVEGRKAWDTFRREMHPGRLLLDIGALSAQLAAAPRGPATAAPVPITAAVPSTKPLVGSPRARPATAQTGEPSFDDWMAQEDAKEKAEKLRAAGLHVPA